MVAGTQIGLVKAGLGTIAEIVRLGVPAADLWDGAFPGFGGKVPGGLGLGLTVGLGEPLVGVGLGDVLVVGLGDVLGLGLGQFVLPRPMATTTPW